MSRNPVPDAHFDPDTKAERLRLGNPAGVVVEGLVLDGDVERHFGVFGLLDESNQLVCGRYRHDEVDGAVRDSNPRGEGIPPRAPSITLSAFSRCASYVMQGGHQTAERKKTTAAFERPPSALRSRLPRADVFNVKPRSGAPTSGPEKKPSSGLIRGPSLMGAGPTSPHSPR